MKIAITLFFISFANLVLGQDLNEQLYRSVTKHDSTQVEALLNKGADANFRKKVMSFEASLVIIAIQNNDTKIIISLINHKVDVNYKDFFNTTPLMYAAHNGNLIVINALLAAGADPTAQDGQGNSVLSAAKESKNQEAIDLIQKLQKN